METEVNFYFKLIPELISLRSPMPKTFPVLWGDYKSTDKEILLLENLEKQGFISPPPSPEGNLYFIIFTIHLQFFYIELYNRNMRVKIIIFNFCSFSFRS